MKRVTVVHNAFGDLFKTVVVYNSELDGDDLLNEAFKLTNSIDTAWYENEDLEIELDGKDGIRSTNVGDFIEVFYKSVEGLFISEWYEVDSFGFRKIERIDIVEYYRIINEERVYIKEPFGMLALNASLGLDILEKAAIKASKNLKEKWNNV